MERIDLAEIHFTQAQVLAIVPDLKAKTLQDWNDLGLIDTANRDPGRQGKQLYNGAGIVCLAFMAAVASQGIRPGITRELASKVWDRALKLHSEHPIVDDGIRPQWFVDASTPNCYLSGYIVNVDGHRRMLLLDTARAETLRMALIFGDAYTVIDIDFLILRILNRMYALLAGIDLSDLSRQPP